MDRQTEIARAALDLLEETGAESVSLRAVAARLGVRQNTVSWHVGSKSALLELMADEILAEVRLDGLPPQWEPRLHELVRRYRAALLAHRDGASVVAGTYAARSNTLAVADALVATLLEAGLPEPDAAWGCWTIVYFTLGLTVEEQRSSRTAEASLRDAVTPETYPALLRTLDHLGTESFAERHAFGLSVILDGLRARVH